MAAPKVERKKQKLNFYTEYQARILNAAWNSFSEKDNMQIVAEGKHKGCVRGFHHNGVAWYRDSALNGDTVDEVTFGFYSVEGGTTGEMSVRWAPLQGKNVPQLRVFDDAWHALAEMKDLLDALALHDNQTISPEKFCEILLACGFVDMTARTQGDKSWRENR